MDRTCNTHDGDEKYIKILVVQPEEKNPLRKPGRRWEGNIKMYLMEIECGLDSSGSG
jgi:hypothetical protein